jgi:DNA-binding MarR family transcriptional regulator
LSHFSIDQNTKTPEESIIFYFLELSNLLKTNGDKITLQYGITTQQWLLLLHLAHDPNIPFFEREPPEKALMASDLAKSLNVSRPNISSLLNVLFEKQLILTHTDAQDKRKRYLSLSAKGQEIVEAINPGRKTTNQWLFEGISEQDKQTLLNTMRIIGRKMLGE